MILQLPQKYGKVGLTRSAKFVKPGHKPLILKDFLQAADSIKP